MARDAEPAGRADLGQAPGARSNARLADHPDLSRPRWRAIDDDSVCTPHWRPHTPARQRGGPAVHLRLDRRAARRDADATPTCSTTPPRSNSASTCRHARQPRRDLAAALPRHGPGRRHPGRRLRRLSRRAHGAGGLSATPASLAGGHLPHARHHQRRPEFRLRPVRRPHPARRAGRAGPVDVDRWRSTAPSRCAPSTLRRFTERSRLRLSRAAFYPCYGLAEATLMVTGGARQRTASGRCPSRTTAPSSAAASIDDQQVLVVDPTTRTMRHRSDRRDVGQPARASPPATGASPTLRASQSSVPASQTRRRRPYLRTGDLGFSTRRRAVHHRPPEGSPDRRRPQDPGRRHRSLPHRRRPRPAPAQAASLRCRSTSTARSDSAWCQRSSKPPDRLTGLRRPSPAPFVCAWPRPTSCRCGAVVLTRRGSVPRTSSGKVRRADCRAGLARRPARAAVRMAASSQLDA